MPNGNTQQDAGGETTTAAATTTVERKEVKLPPPIWNPEVKSYEDFRFQVGLWDKACDKANITKGERGYKLYDKLKDITGISNYLFPFCRDKVLIHVFRYMTLIPN